MLSSQLANTTTSFGSNNLKRSTSGTSSLGTNSQNGNSQTSSGNYHQQLIQGNSAYENTCLRCGAVVYQVDKIGPLKDFTFYHHGCFKCLVCGTKLTLKTYYNNQQDNDDKEVYCQSHVPKTGPGKLDGLSVGIKAALRAPKTSNLVNEQIRGNNYNPLNSCAFNGTSNMTNSHNHSNGNSSGLANGANNSRLVNMAGRFDASALHIQHGINATKLQSNYRPNAEQAKITEFLNEDEQRRLEMLHRAEEDALYRQFAKKRAEEETQICSEIREEWESELEKLTSRLQNNNLLSKERAHLEKNMTIKLDRKKETLTRKLLEQERQATAELVDKQSKEMINLITEKLFEYQKQTGDEHQTNGLSSSKQKSGSKSNLNLMSTIYPAQPPQPSAAVLSKSELYTDPAVFDHIDQVAINVAREDQCTFTDLVRLLIEHCETDIEKARAIFRWITVKNLNTMQFDDNLIGDSPINILRGIKHGTESYHVLFKRLCSYAGLHCVVIKGYSKSAGYQPGVKFEDNRFRNSWNAVYVAGGWRFVQCNWGARHLINFNQGVKGKSDSLRYEYDDHYFLTDPREFIFEFYPLQHDWQLLKKPITLQEFEEMPFVRSLFFRYGLYFPSSNNDNYNEISFDLPERSISCKAVLHTDTSGAATVRIGMPTKLIPSLIFHYNLKFFDRETDEYEGVSLKRYVMQSVSGNIVSFRVHAPCSGQFIMDIFANATTPREYITGEPMKFKSVCKFKLIASDLQTVMVPLPMCASGEWGNQKALRLFGLVAITNESALVFCNDNNLELQFRMTRPLTDFMASLHKNNVDEKKLAKYVSCHIDGDIVSIYVKFPSDHNTSGQYGLDIYCREVGNQASIVGEKQLLTHCCKYLINRSVKPY